MKKFPAKPSKDDFERQNSVETVKKQQKIDEVTYRMINGYTKKFSEDEKNNNLSLLDFINFTQKNRQISSFCFEEVLLTMEDSGLRKIAASTRLLFASFSFQIDTMLKVFIKSVKSVYSEMNSENQLKEKKVMLLRKNSEILEELLIKLTMENPIDIRKSVLKVSQLEDINDKTKNVIMEYNKKISLEDEVTEEKLKEIKSRYKYISRDAPTELPEGVTLMDYEESMHEENEKLKADFERKRDAKINNRVNEILDMLEENMEDFQKNYDGKDEDPLVIQALNRRINEDLANDFTHSLKNINRFMSKSKNSQQGGDEREKASDTIKDVERNMRMASFSNNEIEKKLHKAEGNQVSDTDIKDSMNHMEEGIIEILDHKTKQIALISMQKYEEVKKSMLTNKDIQTDITSEELDNLVEKAIKETEEQCKNIHKVEIGNVKVQVNEYKTKLKVSQKSLESTEQENINQRQKIDKFEFQLREQKEKAIAVGLRADNTKKECELELEKMNKKINQVNTEKKVLQEKQDKLQSRLGKNADNESEIELLQQKKTSLKSIYNSLINSYQRVIRKVENFTNETYQNIKENSAKADLNLVSHKIKAEMVSKEQQFLVQTSENDTINKVEWKDKSVLNSLDNAEEMWIKGDDEYDIELKPEDFLNEELIAFKNDLIQRDLYDESQSGLLLDEGGIKNPVEIIKKSIVALLDNCKKKVDLTDFRRNEVTAHKEQLRFFDKTQQDERLMFDDLLIKKVGFDCKKLQDIMQEKKESEIAIMDLNQKVSDMETHQLDEVKFLKKQLKEFQSVTDSNLTTERDANGDKIPKKHRSRNNKKLTSELVFNVNIEPYFGDDNMSVAIQSRIKSSMSKFMSEAHMSHDIALQTPEYLLPVVTREIVIEKEVYVEMEKDLVDVCTQMDDELLTEKIDGLVSIYKQQVFEEKALIENKCNELIVQNEELMATIESLQRQKRADLIAESRDEAHKKLLEQEKELMDRLHKKFGKRSSQQKLLENLNENRRDILFDLIVLFKNFNNKDLEEEFEALLKIQNKNIKAKGANFLSNRFVDYLQSEKADKSEAEKFMFVFGNPAIKTNNSGNSYTRKFLELQKLNQSRKDDQAKHKEETIPYEVEKSVSVERSQEAEDMTPEETGLLLSTIKFTSDVQAGKNKHALKHILNTSTHKVKNKDFNIPTAINRPCNKNLVDINRTRLNEESARKVRNTFINSNEISDREDEDLQDRKFLDLKLKRKVNTLLRFDSNSITNYDKKESINWGAQKNNDKSFALVRNTTLPPNKFTSKFDPKGQSYFKQKAYNLSLIEKNSISNYNIDSQKLRNRGLDSKDSLTQPNSFEKDKPQIPSYSKKNSLAKVEKRNRHSSSLVDYGIFDFHKNLDTSALDVVLDSPNTKKNRFNSCELSIKESKEINLPDINFQKDLNPFLNDNYLKESFYVDLYTYISQTKSITYNAKLDMTKIPTVNIKSHEYINFVRSVEAFAEKHKSCGAKCRHLEKFYESLGLTRSSSKKKKRNGYCSSAVALPKLNAKNSLLCESLVLNTSYKLAGNM